MFTNSKDTFSLPFSFFDQSKFFSSLNNNQENKISEVIYLKQNAD